MQRLLLCCDLDRTVLPNGKARESSGVRELFERLIQEAGLILTYVSGRNLSLLQQAMLEYRIPRPDYAIGDVGTTLYQLSGTEWREIPAWSKHIGEDWRDLSAAAIAEFLANITELRLQEPEKQNLHKLSYYLDLNISEASIIERIRWLLNTQRIKANIIYSVDEMAEIGLIDILPQRASKYHAIEYLSGHLGIDISNTMFAGDSGNDLPVLISDIPAVLVNNAQPQIKHLARRLADNQGCAQQLYLARGGFYGLNGNYSAGILEGLVHYHGELRPMLEAIMKDSG